MRRGSSSGEHEERRREAARGVSRDGGSVFFVGERTPLVDFAATEQFADFACIQNNTDAVRWAFSPYASVSITQQGAPAFDVFAMHRRDDTADMLLLVNTSLDSPFSGQVSVKSLGQVQLFDTIACERHEIASASDDGCTEFYLEMSKGGSALLFISIEREALPVLAQNAQYTVQECKNDLFEIELDAQNILLLDRPQFCINGESREPMHILEADKAVRDFMGFERKSNQMYQPWFKRTFFGDSDKGCEVKLSYAFSVNHIPDGDLFLCLEQPEYHTLYLNGVEIEKADCGFFADKCIRKIRLDSGLLKRGENILTSVCSFVEETDLEAVYILGDFGVSLDKFNATMIPPVRTLAIGDITSQGLPFYAGNIKYHVKCSHTPWKNKVKADHFKGIALKLYEDGKEPLLMPFEPYEAPIHADDFKLELLCSMGNALGIERHLEDAYPLEVQGLMSKPEILALI